MPSPWHKKTRTTAVAHQQSLNSQSLQRDDSLIMPRLSKKQLSLSANRESLVGLLQQQDQQQPQDPRPVRQLLHKMQMIINIPSSTSPMTLSLSPSLSKKHRGRQNQRHQHQGEQQQQLDSLAICSRRTLQESTSDMSNDEEATMVTAESLSVEQVEHHADVEVPTTSAAPVVVLPQKQKMRKSFLKKSLRHLGVSKVSVGGKSNRTSSSSSNSSSKKKKEEKRLPDPGIFSNNHVLVNRERVVRGLSKLNRSRFLDSMAHSHAVDLAHDENLVHSVDILADLQRQLGSNEVGENVQRGPNIRQMHESAMNRGSTSRGNILRPAYVEFGMATALGKDGKLYMVQLFRGLPKQDKKEEQ